ncbi:MAG: hypothetical protein IKB01_01615 [Lachnospiraceae bacterium]|nr:hypothetical protein [Lachnospiraceae bacterium]
MRNSRASLFLMELMISILFFSLSSAVCIQLFVKAHTINTDTENQSNATLIAQDISELFHHTYGNKEQFLSYYDKYETEENEVLLFFTDNNHSCSKENAHYTATLSFNQDGAFRILTMKITCSGKEDILYSSTLKKYIPTTISI